MKKFKLIHKSGPHGDACSTYGIQFNTDKITVQEFLAELPDNEWGCVRLQKKLTGPSVPEYLTEDEKYTEIDIEYKNGAIRDLPAYVVPYLNYEIDTHHGWANGGWSNMDYLIRLKNYENKQ